MATTKPESVRSIPAPNAVRDQEVRRILQAIIQVLRFYEQTVQEIKVPDEFSGENIGDGKVVLLGKKKGVWQFATLVAGDNVTLKQDGGAIKVSSQDTVGIDTYQVKEASGGVAGYLGEKLSSLGPESGASPVLAGVQEDGTVGIRSLTTKGNATGQVEILAGAQEDGSIGIRATIGDGSFIKAELLEDGCIKISCTGVDVTNYDSENTQVFGHVSGSPCMIDWPNSGDAVNLTVITDVQFDSTSGYLQVKTRGIRIPADWMDEESAWTNKILFDEFTCPE